MKVKGEKLTWNFRDSLFLTPNAIPAALLNRSSTQLSFTDFSLYIG